MAVHGFRAFFDTQLTSITKNPVVTSLLLGHDIGLKGSYFKPDAETLLGEYRRGMDAVTIDDANRLKQENLHLKERVDDIRLMQASLDSQETQLQEYQKYVRDLKMHKETMEIIGGLIDRINSGEIKLPKSGGKDTLPS